MNEPNETLEFAGPVNDGWYRTQIPDWISLNPDLKDGAFRLYCILRALILEKQKNRIRVLSHEQIAFLAVGKNGKPASISTIKALLANLQEVGLVSNPDGSRIVTSSGPGTIQSRRRYQLADWPQAPGEYTGWRNAFDKLDAFTDDWRETRTDVSPGRIEGQKSDVDSQNSDEPGQKTDVDGQKSGENPAPTSEDAPSLKELPEGGALTSSSSGSGHAEPEPAPAPEKKTKTLEPEDIVLERLADEQCTTDEAVAVVNRIEAQGDNGRPIIRIVPWVKGRSIRDLRRDLAQVRRYADAPPADAVCSEHRSPLAPGFCECCKGDMNTGDFETVRKILDRDGATARPDLARHLGAPQNAADNVRSIDEGERIRRMQRRPSGVVGGSRNPVADHAFYSQHTDDELKARFLG